MTGLEWVLAALGIDIVMGICGIVALVLIIRTLYRRIRRSRAVGGAVLRTRARVSRGPQRAILALRVRLEQSLDSGKAAVDLATHSEDPGANSRGSSVASSRRASPWTCSCSSWRARRMPPCSRRTFQWRPRAWSRSSRWCADCEPPSHPDSRASPTTPSPRSAPRWTGRSRRCTRAWRSCAHSTDATRSTSRPCGHQPAASTVRPATFETKRGTPS